jgi:hypothetical protein
VKKPKGEAFSSEADMCAQFISEIGDDWTAYCETAGFDILLVRKSDGYQIGIEAKLKFNVNVLTQILEDGWYLEHGPDYRAILIPYDASSSLGAITSYIGITVIRVSKNPRWGYNSRFTPNLPNPAKDNIYLGREEWFDWCPTKRCILPEYIPDVAAGASAPLQLTKWKISAIKIAIILEERGWVARPDFKHVGIDYRRWIAKESGWLKPGEIGWVADRPPDFKAQHPKVWEQVRADMDKWFPPTPEVAPRQKALFARKR